MPTISDTQALSILRESYSKTQDAQGRATTAAMGAQVAAKQASAQSAAKSAHADQYSSIAKMGAQGLGLGLNTKMNIAANKGLTPRDMLLSPAEASKRQAKNAGINAATQGNGVGNVVGQAGDAIDQNVGFAKASSDAKIEGKQADLQETIASQLAESAKANKEKAVKSVEGVEDFAKGIFDRAKQVLDKLF